MSFLDLCSSDEDEPPAKRQHKEAPVKSGFRALAASTPRIITGSKTPAPRSLPASDDEYEVVCIKPAHQAAKPALKRDAVVLVDDDNDVMLIERPSTTKVQASVTGEVWEELDWSGTYDALGNRIDDADEEAATLAFLEEEQRAAQRQLDQRLYKCKLCLEDDVKLSDMLTLSCDHKFCCGCFTRYCESKITENEVGENDFCCPFAFDDGKKCKQPVTIHEIKSHVSEELFEKYERFTLKRFAEANADTCRFCPKCNEWFAEIPQTDNDEAVWKSVQCGAAGCSHRFCGKCGEAPHKGQKDQNLSCAEFAAWKQQNEEGDKGFAELMSSKEYAQCPKCSQMGERQGKQNCKFTYCRCGERYCFLCGVGLEEKNHYNHFQGSKGCTGPFGNGCRGIDDPQITRARVVSEVMKARSGSGPSSSSSSSSSASSSANAAAVPAGAVPLAMQVAAAAGAAAAVAAQLALLRPAAKRPKKQKARKRR